MPSPSAEPAYVTRHAVNEIWLVGQIIRSTYMPFEPTSPPPPQPAAMSARPSKESTRATPNLDLDPKYDDYDYPTTSSEPQSGHPGHTTKEQNAQVHQLRAELEKLGYKDRLDTLTLLRFLRARKFNVDLSKQMYATSPP